jgi:hypothetical protein
MFPTIFVPTALFGLAEATQIPTTTLDVTPIVVGLALALVAAVAGVWVHRHQEARSLTPRSRPRTMGRMPAPLTA